jgi:nucleoside-diphosphate-sugar epimerase
MKMLITGDAGFVGREFHRQYDGHDITGVDIVNGIDARDFFRTDTRRFDLVVHLAAVVGGRVNIENNPLSVAIDLAIDAEMWNWALRTKPRRVVYFSSSAAYPIALQRKGMKYHLHEDDIDLDDIESPDLTYGWSKLTGEYQARFVAEELPVHVFRPFSGYGTDQDLTYPFPSFIQRGKLRADPFEIWGDGQQVRDFMHITDIVQAVTKAVDEDRTGVVNLGTGRATSFNDLAKIVAAEAGYTPRLRRLTAQPTGVHYRVADVTRMSEFYTPKISLEQGVRMALNNQL